MESDRHGDGISREVRDWAVSRIDDRTEADPDGKQNEQSNVWTSKGRLKMDSEKTDLIERDDVDELVQELKRNGDVLTWFGLVAPATDAHALAIIDSETMTPAPRKTLVSRCNAVLNGVYNE